MYLPNPHNPDHPHTCQFGNSFNEYYAEHRRAKYDLLKESPEEHVDKVASGFFSKLAKMFCCNR